MDNNTLNEIKNFAIQKLQDKYGFCGVAMSDNFAMITSGDIQITIKIKE